MKKYMFILGLWMMSFVGVFADDAVTAAMDKIAPHPRLILTDMRLNELRDISRTDPVLTRYVSDVLSVADGFLKAPLLKYVIPDGLRLLETSRNAKTRIAVLAFAWRWTQNEKYKRRCLGEMETVCRFKDWNPRHFLDTAEMAFGLAIGYDWLYRDLTVAQRQFFSERLIHLAFSPNASGVTARSNNWGTVCNGGLAVAALAVTEDSPILAARVISRAVEQLPLPTKNYEPDGLWYEGMCYWEYNGEYLVYALSAFQSALDTDFSLSGLPGASEAALFALHTTSPTKHSVRFADFPSDRDSLSPYLRPTQICASVDKLGYHRINTVPRGRLAPPSYWQLFWFAKQFENPGWAAFQNQLLTQNTANLWDVVFYIPAREMSTIPLCYFFRGKTEMVLMRTSHTDPNAGWVSIKSGVNNTPHGHIDGGNFEFEFNGIRWGYDLGREDYNLPGFWDGRKNGKRWTYYRNGPLSHNMPVIDGVPQSVDGKVSVIDFSADQKSVTLDMKGGYDLPKLTQYRRSFVLKDTALILTEQFLSADALPILWGMTTDAEIDILPDGNAVLLLNGKKLLVKIASPEGLTFSVSSCDRPKPENPNIGFSRLEVKTKTVKDKPLVLKIIFESL